MKAVFRPSAILLLLFGGNPPSWSAPVQIDAAFMSVHARDYNYANGDNFQDAPLVASGSGSISALDGTTSAIAAYAVTDLGDSAIWQIDVGRLSKTASTEYVESIGIVRFTTDKPVDYEVTGQFSSSGNDPEDAFSATAFVVNYVSSEFFYSETDSQLGGSLASSFNGAAEGNHNVFLTGLPSGVLPPGQHQFQFHFLIDNQDEDRVGIGMGQGSVRFELAVSAIPEPASALLFAVLAAGYGGVGRRYY
jgi:hypothetical protein